MKEDFLHYIWQFQYFEKGGLKLDSGEKLNILKPGFKNSDAGPDFKEAKIIIGEVEWAGHVEIHLSSSDWKAHRHEQDPAYNNVILHVVWKNNAEAIREDGTPIPTLSLEKLTDPTLLYRYEYLINQADTILCSDRLKEVKPISRLAMYDKAFASRLEEKSAFVFQLLSENEQNWEESAYQLLAQNFGFKVNNQAFLHLAKALPLKILRKHADSLAQMEALVFGQAGFLDTEPTDEYQQALQKEYRFLAHKYRLGSKKIDKVEWKFARLRPANSPTLRLAQFAALLQKEISICSRLIFSGGLGKLEKAFEAEASAYWKTHYNFGKKGQKSFAKLGKGSRDILIINTVIPVLEAYAAFKDQAQYHERAVEFLERLKPENNKITREWKALGIEIKSAYDSQALLGLYRSFCEQKKCLSCNIGVEILGKK
ncbi:DUF2851 family protein [Flammeovirgaceae bacterium SG7u.111]|nr:DUF2851 family protein [Flammeovirgaceae bacterium SG7u.132]WPO37450.1 DUF2851 family protein [Flammeovirgaceae bacterium SG7u.111]